jgi:hypothetical protein
MYMLECVSWRRDGDSGRTDLLIYIYLAAKKDYNSDNKRKAEDDGEGEKKKASAGSKKSKK